MKYISRQRNSDIDIITESSGALNFLYETAIGRILLWPFTTKLFSNLSALYMNSCLSKHKIAPFVDKNDINIYEYDQRNYKSYIRPPYICCKKLYYDYTVKSII